MFIHSLLEKVKGNGIRIDRRIPSSYLLGTMLSRMMSLIYGMVRLGTLKRVYVSPSASIRCASKMMFKKNLSIADNCRIDALSENGLVLGENVSIGYQTQIELTGSLSLLGKGMVVGDNVGFGTHGRYGSGAGFVKIGSNTIFGNYISIHPENHIFKDASKPIREQGVVSKGGVEIGDNCWIGAKVTILDGTKIGNNCIVAAGAVVRGEYPDGVLIGGVPSKIIRKIY